jgi:hypothetical protein
VERAVCERCRALQPRDWAPGDLCTACGAAVRAEVRCAWCAAWVPAVRYCRACGCELVPSGQYAAARMLKSAGVDRLSLVQRLRELDPEQAATFTLIYNAQLAVVTRRVEEARYAEARLLQRGFAPRVEEMLVPGLPLEPDSLARLAAGPGTLDGEEPDVLCAIASASPVALTRELAALALLRLGRFRAAHQCAGRSLESNDPAVALEAALAFAHWRARLEPWERDPVALDRWRLVQAAEPVDPRSPLRPWAAAAIALAWFGPYQAVPDPPERPSMRPSGAPRDATPPEWLREELVAGLASRDPDLRLSCAMALGDDCAIAPLLASEDPQARDIARRYLAARSSPAIAPVLLQAPEEICVEILCALRPPLPQPLEDAVLRLASRDRGDLRETCARLLLSEPRPEVEERLLRIAAADKDEALFRMLLRTAALPGAPRALHALLRSGVPGDWSYEIAAHFDFTDKESLRLALERGPETVEALIVAAARKGAEPAAGRFLAHVALSPFPAEIRSRAYAELMNRGVWNLYSAEGIQALFGERRLFARAMIGALDQPDPALLLSRILTDLCDRWSDISRAFLEDRRTIGRLVKTVARLAETRAEAADLLAAIALSAPKQALPAAIDLLRRRGTRWHCRNLAERLAPLLPASPASEPADGAEPAADSPEPEAPQPEVRDHAVLLPVCPLRTLAEYVAFLRALSATADPQSVLAAHGMPNQQAFTSVLLKWSQLLAADNALALRYAELMAREPPEA